MFLLRVRILPWILVAQALLLSFESAAQGVAFFNNRIVMQGYLKQGFTPLNDSAGYPMMFVIRQNSTAVWCQTSAAAVPVINGVFNTILTGSSNCLSLSNSLSASVFAATANTDLFTVDVSVNISKSGNFADTSTAIFAGIDVVAAPLALLANVANTAGTALVANSASSATTAGTATNVSGIVALANGGTGATNAAGAQAALGLGNLAVLSTDGNASHVLYGNGTWGVPTSAPVTSVAGRTGAITLTVSDITGAAGSGNNSNITSLSGLTTPLSISQGGTGGTSAAAVRTALGLASAGVNSDITSLTGITTPLTIAEGGTNTNGFTANSLVVVNGFGTGLTDIVGCSPGQTISFSVGGVWGCSTPVSTVGLSLPNIFSVSVSSVTSSGTLTASLASQTANTIFAAPNGSAGAPSFRALVAADIPTLNQNTTGSAASATNAANAVNAVNATNAANATSAASAAVAATANAVAAGSIVPASLSSSAQTLTSSWTVPAAQVSGTVANASSATNAANAVNATNATNATYATTAANASSLAGGTWAVPGAIGATTANTGAFTTLSTSSTTTISAGAGTIGLTSTGGINLNASTNGAVNIGTGTSTGTVSIGSTVAQTVNIQNTAPTVTGGTVNIQATGTTAMTQTTNIGNITAVGNGVNIKAGTGGSTTGTGVIAFTGHLASGGMASPSLSGTAVLASGNDTSGKITISSAVSTTLTFKVPYATAPNCVMTPSSGTVIITAISTTALTFTPSATGTVWYICLQ